MNRSEILSRIGLRADHNLARWGKQDVPTLIMAMVEELGEISQAHLQAIAEGGDPWRVIDEALDLAPLCVQLVELVQEQRKGTNDE